MTLKILLVEDNEMNRDMLSRRLYRKGYHMILAEDGQQGIELALSVSPDVILMDMNLPIIDGWQATKTIRKHEKPLGKHTPIIAVTSHAMTSDQEKAINAGCDHYEPKPINLDQLIEKIELLHATFQSKNAEKSCDETQP
ncbi:MAG: two-component system response regulator [Cycloclasticus pugetii]|jgi:two-component system response regulator|uniref:response regulator n=1 Tax=Cycloclasticus TaxID=34067 RepID=UPI00091915C2|nr:MULTISPECIES: response regulator [Cycloclasticus]MBV1898795.1 response regulator [Cycloclasticus sp.]MDF1830423.1 response regulator [Cycloclasticus pugetii]SHI90117.1 two-component system, unclassified family, response regulator [Cycloclasticus pugetii]|tara:strand:+ start:1509 stop:1928 length:420 start_codon:yes stop_codon:yes gene_type:complete